MNYMTVADAAKKWGLTPRNVQIHCEKGNIPGTTLLDLHVRFEKIHPFQDGNGRVGRLILLKECLKHGHTPFVIAENLKQFYYLGLSDWRSGNRLRLLDTCRTGQDVFILGLRQFGHAKLAEKAEKEVAIRT